MQQLKGVTYPDDMYLVKDEDNKVKWFRKDPMKHPGRDNPEVNLIDEIFEYFGDGDILNPLRIRIQGIHIQRGEPFDISLPGLIRKGKVDRHIEDLEGNHIDILASIVQKATDFPINGVLLSRDGEIIATRTYSLQGDCSDGVRSHRLVAVQGTIDLSLKSSRQGKTDTPDTTDNPETPNDEPPIDILELEG